MSDGPQDAGTHRIETLHQGRFLRLIRDGRWEYVQRVQARGGAAMVAVTPARELLLVEQYRVPMQGRTIELPAGIIGDDPANRDEPAELAGLRELEEETGFHGTRARMLLRGPTAPGLTSELTHLVLVTGLRRVHQGGGVDGEDITPHVVPLDTAADWLNARIAEGLWVEPRVYAALYFAARVPEDELKV
jgi:ADP-ribose pyrophosphatase